MKHDEVIIVGGGHAGVEAASAAARMGAAVTLVTMSRDGIGAMSCNPAMGGLGKGHLIREIDAMGGIMGCASDEAGIQYRLLNRRKGPAVQGPRAQIDRRLYRQAVQRMVTMLPGLRIVEGLVVDLIVDAGRVAGVVLDDGTHLHANAVVLTTGTFLNGVMHVGEERRSGGRVGEAASVPLADRLYGMDLPMGRLKTGTPPRLDGRTIDWDALQAQPGDPDPVMLSFLSDAPRQRQVACAITHTNPETHRIIRDNLHRSAMYSGNISGIGPRYCPSIEDKIGRFADKDSHQIFLEPEGLDDDTVYPNGISTSLPVEVQNAYVRSIAGLEDADILQPGYAIEYDYVDPRALDMGLQVRSCPGLWLAGQINGTTGYEEAGAQGLVAGLSAAAAVTGRAQPRFSRTSSYIGVMLDDLLSRGVTEPYRMFTSRAEFRLSLRCDNADQRLTPMARDLGLLDAARIDHFDRKMARLTTTRRSLETTEVSSKTAHAAGLPVAQHGPARSAWDLLSISNVGLSDLGRVVPLADLDSVSLAQLEREAAYAHYLERQARDADRLRREEETAIPADLDFDTIGGLSNELREKIRDHRPESLAAAAKIEGMTPAAINAILLKLKARELETARAS